jgi:hypothetical protein
MYTRKSKGHKTVPCGTPDATGFVDDEFPYSTTVWQMGTTVADAVQPRQMSSIDHH